MGFVSPIYIVPTLYVGVNATFTYLSGCFEYGLWRVDVLNIL